MMPARKGLAAVVLAAAACAAPPGLAAADPIIPNASFSLGNSGFASGYAHASSPTLPDLRLMYPEGTYTVGASPSLYHSLWPGFGDHTMGDGGMLIVNGSPSAGVLVWSVTVDVEPDTEYDFSAWAASVYPRSPASLAFSVNGTAMDAPFLLPSETGMWQRFSAGWYSSDDTTARLSLVDLNTVRYGNDFALDDIALALVRPSGSTRSGPDPDPDDPPPAVPEPSSLILLGSGLAAAAGRRRRRSA